MSKTIDKYLLYVIGRHGPRLVQITYNKSIAEEWTDRSGFGGIHKVYITQKEVIENV